MDYFHQTLSPKIDCGYFPMNDNQDGRQNSRRLVSLHVWTLLLGHLSPIFFQILCIDYVHHTIVHV